MKTQPEMRQIRGVAARITRIIVPCTVQYSTVQYSTVQYSTVQHLGVDLCRDAEQGEGGHEAGRDGGGDGDHAQRPPACGSIPSKEKLQTSFNCKGR